MHGAVPPLSQYAFAAWCSVKTRTTLLFIFTLDVIASFIKISRIAVEINTEEGQKEHSKSYTPKHLLLQQIDILKQTTSH